MWLDGYLEKLAVAPSYKPSHLVYRKFLPVSFTDLDYSTRYHYRTHVPASQHCGTAIYFYKNSVLISAWLHLICSLICTCKFWEITLK
jgi:hypothetical protein